MVSKILLAVLSIIVMFSLTSCQTIKGVGSDLGWTGEKGAEVVGQE